MVFEQHRNEFPPNLYLYLLRVRAGNFNKCTYSSVLAHPQTPSPRVYCSSKRKIGIIKTYIYTYIIK